MELYFVIALVFICITWIIFLIKIIKRQKEDKQIDNSMIDTLLAKYNKDIEQIVILNQIIKEKEARIQELEEIEKTHKKDNKKVLQDLSTLEKQYSDLLKKNQITKKEEVAEKPKRTRKTRKTVTSTTETTETTKKTTRKRKEEKNDGIK